MDHFEATCLFRTPAESSVCASDLLALDRLSIDPKRDLYGGILFQSGRFRRLNNYRVLRAKECVAEITSDGNAEWFNPYLPGQLVLGDPGVRDAAIHAIQACIPHATLLPTGIQRLTFHHKSSTGPLFVHARECSHRDNTFTYSLCVFGSDGYVHERWEGLRLRAVADNPVQGPLHESLMGPNIERRLQELIPGTDISVAFVRSAETDRQVRSGGAIQIALREKTEVLRRPDGKPEVRSGHFVSASHAGDLTLAIAGPNPLGCDIERVVERTVPEWLALLGENRFTLVNLVAKNLDETLSLAATRIWTVTEALTKVGMMTDAPIRLDSLHATDWALFSSGSVKIASFPIQIRDNAEKLVLSVVTQLVSGK